MKEFLARNKNKTIVGIVDDEDLDLVRGNVNLCSCGYARLSGIRLHKVIMKRILNGADIPSDKVIDHINRNRLDNRRSNLRLCTVTQNAINRSKKESSSRYIGVSWKKTKNKWYAQIKQNKKVKYLGLFECEKEAAKRYNEEAINLFGEFAVLNKI